MAISGGDGSIILTTKVDESGITKSTTSIKAQFAKVGSYLKTIGTSIQTTFSKVGVGIKNTFSKIGKWLKNFATSIAAQFATIFGLYALINFSKQAGEFATQTEASVQRLIDIYGSASKSVGDFIDQNARALGMSKAAAASFSSVYGNLFSVWADQSTNAELTNRYLNMTAVVASKTGRTVEDVQERIRSGLLGNTEAIEDLGVFVNVKTIEMTDAFQRMASGKSWEQLDAYTQQQIRSMAILEQATAKYGNEVADTSATIRSRFNAAYQDFQNSWGNIVNNVLLPVLEILTKIFDIATKGLNVLSGRNGQILENTNQIAENIEQQTENQKNLNKELKKSLAAFDDIQILSSQNAENTSGGLDSGMQVVGGNLGGETFDGSAYVAEIDKTLSLIMGIVGGALIAVGFILLFTGHIGWGIGLIIAGASIFAVSMATVSSSAQVAPISEKLMAIMAIAGVALTAIGLILLFNGSWKWGIGFIIAGASALAVSIVAVKSGNATGQAEQMLLDIMLIAGSALLALGIILLLVGQITPLSIGLVVAGAGSLAGAIAINPKAVGEKIKKFFQDNAGLIVGVSLALLVIGILLCFTQMLPLAIGLIVVGAAGLATTVTLNWDTIKEKVSGAFTKIKEWLKTWGLLVLGVILCLTGVGLPLGIALMKKGAENLAKSENPKWQSIGQKIQEVVNNIKSWLKTWGLLVLGVVLCFTGVGIPLGIALIKKGAENLTKSENPKWNSIGDKIQNAINTIFNWLKTWGLLVLGIILSLTGVSIPLGIALIKKGAENLAKSENPTWNKMYETISEKVKQIKEWLKTYGLLVLGVLLCFTGVGLGLGIALVKKGVENLTKSQEINWSAIYTKITEKVNAIKKWLNTYGLLVLGILLCFTGVGIGLGMGLIKKGASNLADAKDPLWNTVYDKIKEVWKKIKAYWTNNIAQYFTSKWWSALAKKIGNGFISGFEGMINSVINAFERMINWIIGGLNKISFSLPEWDVLGEAAGKKFGINISKVNWGNISIPRLAQGTVIPGGKEFLAVLGDQPKGQTNIEAPLQTIVEAMNIALAQNGGGRTTKEEHYYLNETELMSIVYKLFKGGERLTGKTLANGGVY